MTQYIDKSKLVDEMEERKKRNVLNEGAFEEDTDILSFIDTLESKETDFSLIISWFDHIAQIANYKLNSNGERMTDAQALIEIKCLAKDSSELIKKWHK